MIREDGKTISNTFGNSIRSNGNYFIGNHNLIDRDGNVTYPYSNVNSKLYNDYDSIWMRCKADSLNINDEGEIIAIGSTIYGEQHAMLLTPLKSE